MKPEIAVIHDPRMSERYTRLMKELATQGIMQYELFPSVYDWRSVKRSINLAHKQCVEYAKLKGYPEICIMEDDVRFCGYGAFDYFLSKKPAEFDLYLGGVYVGDIQPDNTVREFSGFHCYIIRERFYDTFLSLPADAHIDNACAGKGLFYVCNPFACVQYNGFSSNTGKEENYDGLLDGREFYGNFLN